MTTYTAIPNGDVDLDSPVTQPLMTALRDNPIAITEGSTGAPYNQFVWHPHDGVTVGDGNDGVIWDYAVDGVINSANPLETPSFVDGYDYGFYFRNLTLSINLDFNVKYYLAASSAYSSVATLAAMGVAKGPFNGGIIWISTPDIPKYSARLKVEFPILQYNDPGRDPTNDDTADRNFGTTATKVTKMQFLTNTGDINGGKIYMLRRKRYYP